MCFYVNEQGILGTLPIILSLLAVVISSPAVVKTLAFCSLQKHTAGGPSTPTPSHHRPPLHGRRALDLHPYVSLAIHPSSTWLVYGT